jgi:superfamily II DNA or RNA helicase
MLRDYQESVVLAVSNFIRYRQENGYVTAAGGSGKSVMIAKVAEILFDMGFSVVILARSEKLVRQNKEKIGDKYKEYVGIFCAAIGEKRLDKPITVATIQSIYNEIMPHHIDFVLVDECDEIPPEESDDAQYWRFFKANKSPRIIGFTATPFRLKSGKLQWGEEIINIPIAPLIAAGWLCPPINKAVPIDLSDVKITSLGEYDTSQVELIYQSAKIFKQSIEKLLAYGAQRNHPLVFSQTVSHANLICNAIKATGESAITVSGDTDKDYLTDVIIPDFERGKFKYLVNCKLVMVGYDIPCIDMIALLMATKSKRNFEQAAYRGTRLCDGKKDFLLLDMGGNLVEHGGLGSPFKGDSKKREAKQPSGKICPECEEFIAPPTLRECPACGYQFPEPEKRTVSHDSAPDTISDAYYSGESESKIVTLKVSAVSYAKHVKKDNGNVSLRVDYYCEGANYGKVSEWLSPHHATSDWAVNKAHQFFAQRGWDAFGGISKYEMEDLLWHAERLKKPSHITVDYSDKYPRITAYSWDEPEAKESFNLDDDIPF